MLDYDKIAFWVVCAFVGYQLGRLRALHSGTKEEINWLWMRVTSLEEKVRELRKEIRR